MRWNAPHNPHQSVVIRAHPCSISITPARGSIEGKGAPVNAATERFHALNTMFTQASLNLDIFRLCSLSVLYAITAFWRVIGGALA